MWVHFLVPVFGMLFFVSVNRAICKSRPYLVVSAAAVVATLSILHASPRISWFLIGGATLILRVVHRFSRVDDELFMHRGLAAFLDQVILSLKAGASMRLAFQDVARTLSRREAVRLSDILDRFELGSDDRDLSKNARQFLENIRRCQRGSSKIIERYEFWRKVVRLEDEFRRKSRQATLQIRLQAWIAGVLFVPAVSWDAWHTGTFVSPRIFLAILLLAAAQGWIHFRYRSFSWKV